MPPSGDLTDGPQRTQGQESIFPTVDPTSPLRVPIFRAVWTTNLISSLGALIQSVAAAWMMTVLGGSPSEIAMVQAATNLPIPLLALWAGAVADNLDRRIVMIAAQSSMLILSTLLAALAFEDLLSPMVLLAFTFAIACGTAVNGPAWQASVGDMVPRSLLPQAIAYNGMGYNVARSIGPAIGGVIVATAGAATAFLANALSYVGLLAVLIRWRPAPRESHLPREQLTTAMLAGLRYARSSPAIVAVLVRSAIFGVGASAIPALLPLVVRDLIGGGALAYGLLFGGFGVGAVAGAVTNGRLRRRFSNEALVRMATAAVMGGAVLTAASRVSWLSGPALALAGAGWVLALATFNVTVQMSASRWVVARTVALYQTSVFGGMALGSWLAGSLATMIGVDWALAAAAAILVGGWPMSRMFRLPQPVASLDPLRAWREPSVTLPIGAESGPIVIAVEHRVADGDTASFLQLMVERRRIRLRDGAAQWELARNLADPGVWMERLIFATWLDYVRHHERRTVADVESQNALHGLRRPGEEPNVRRLVVYRINGSSGLAASDLATTMSDPTLGA